MNKKKAYKPTTMQNDLKEIKEAVDMGNAPIAEWVKSISKGKSEYTGTPKKGRDIKSEYFESKNKTHVLR